MGEEFNSEQDQAGSIPESGQGDQKPLVDPAEPISSDFNQEIQKIADQQSIPQPEANVETTEEASSVNQTPEANQQSQEVIDPQQEAVETTQQPEVKKASFQEKMEAATTPAELLKIYIELGPALSLEKRVDVQWAMADKLLKLGDQENSMKFLLLSEQGVNIVEQKNIVDGMHEAGTMMRNASEISQVSAESMRKSSTINSESAEHMRVAGNRMSEASDKSESAASSMSRFTDQISDATRRMESSSYRIEDAFRR